MKNNPIRVLQVAGEMRCGGAETMIMNIYRNMDRNHIQFDFVSFSRVKGHFDDEIKRLGGRIFYIPSPKETGVVQFCYNLMKVIKKQGPFHVVHAHTLYNIGLVLLATRIAGVKCRIAHSHSTKATINSNLLRNIYNIVMKKLIHLNATHYLACGVDAGCFLYGESLFNKKGVVLSNAIDVAEYRNDHNSNILAIRNELKLRPETLVIGQVGTLNAIKNHKFSISVGRRLQEKGVDFKMIFVGDGELRDELRKNAKSAGIDKNIIFLGIRSDIPRLMGVFDLLIMPSIFEGLPVTLIEAQAAGIPCVVSDVITIEADLGLGLLKYISLNDDIDKWIHAIHSQRKLKTVDMEQIAAVFKQKGYDINRSIERLMLMYRV
ncbi:glycosyltransferase family 1 protein [Bacillus sp. S13(2024)]|uniref:glycosyltransferase family 1 protein n=1 Tax=unclassified Bacillus (in: firmicutes) TaxID=185979 RepID=UPI003D23AA2D